MGLRSRIFITFGAISALLSACAHPLPRVVSSRSLNSILTPTPPVDPAEFLSELPKRIEKVTEFREIRKWGIENGVRIWAAGGTAVGLGSRLVDELAQDPVNSKKFRYNYYDIYRSTQDVDIVIDGDETVARKLESYLLENFGYLQGEKAVWEVRLLNQARGKGANRKDQLLGGDFRGQNSDSLSTGMIEITDPPKNESRIRDLFDWSSRETRFMRDLFDKRVTYIRQAGHAGTLRARSGFNPEILSAIRALTKAFQYDALIREESIDELRAVIDAFNPNGDFGDVAVHSILKNAAKLFQHSRDVERAADTLDRLGNFRKKLIDFAHIRGDREAARLLSREPLRTFSLNSLPPVKDPFPGYQPTGKTAAMLGIDVVTHETRDFLAYENIMTSRSGKANLFISRIKTEGESAFFGSGAYTSIGTQGVYGKANLNVRYRLHPDAVEGIDFYVNGNFVIVRNGAALMTMDIEASEPTFAELFDLVSQRRFKPEDTGVVRRLEMQIRSTQNNRRDEVRKFGMELLARYEAKPSFFRWEPRLLEVYLELANDGPTKRKIVDAIARARNMFSEEKTKLLWKYGEFGSLGEAMAVFRSIPIGDYWKRENLLAFQRQARTVPHLDRDLREGGIRLVERLRRHGGFKLDAEILTYLQLPAPPDIKHQILDEMQKSKRISTRHRLLCALEFGDPGRLLSRQSDPQMRKFIMEGLRNANPVWRTFNEYETLGRISQLLLQDPRLDGELRYAITDALLGWIKQDAGYVNGIRMAHAVFPALNASRPYRTSVTPFEYRWLMNDENYFRDVWVDIPLEERSRPPNALTRFCRQLLQIFK